MVKLGIIGLPAAGKTSIFNTLTGASYPIGYESGTGAHEIHSAVLDVPDKRLLALQTSFNPVKTTPSKIEYSDIGGLGTSEGAQALPGELLNALEQVDAFVLVLRSFTDPNVPHPLNSNNPQRDLDLIEEEFLLNDMLRIERRITRLSEEWQKGGRDRSEVERETKLMNLLQQTLDEGIPLREIALSPEQARMISGLGMLSRKAMLVVLNIAEEETKQELNTKLPSLSMNAKLELEISELSQEEMATYYHEYGIDTPGAERIVVKSYALMGLITFFTVSEPEIRAWALRAGSTAHQAAGIIHSDMERGFIRAEVVPWDELLEFGSLAEARTAGKLRVEGKDYLLKDGEVIYIRFNV